MAVYNMSKIKEWYEDFNSCKSNYLNNYYQTYKASYIVTNNDPSVTKMQKKLDGYYSRLKNAYSKVGSNWKSLYNDLMNADAALAGQKSSGSVNASGASAKISSMPKLVEYKNDLGVGLDAATGAITVGAGAVTGVNFYAEQVQSQAMQTATSNVQESANQVTQSVSETTEDSGELKNTLIGAASGAAIGAAIGSALPVVGTLLGAGIGAAVGALIGSGVASKIVEAIANGITQIKEKVSDVVGEVKNADTFSEKMKAMGKGAIEIAKKTGATVATVGISAVEGVAKLVEDAVDIVALAGTAIASIGTGVMDLGNLIGAKITGDDSYKSDYTKRMWEGTRSFVSKDYVGNTFDKFYENTSVGKWIKENAFGFETVRAISKEVTEVVGVVALASVTGGSAAVIYGAAKVAEHTETNWQDENTSTAKGLLKGTLQGVADGAFFAIGAKGDKVFKETIKAGSKTALQKTALLGGKTAFEAGTAVAQDFATIGLNTAFSSDTVVDVNGNTVTFNSASDKFKYYYEQAGGAKGLLTSAATASVLSFMSDIGTVYGKGASAVAGTATGGAAIDAIESRTVKNAIGDSASSDVKALKSATSNSKVLANMSIDNAGKVATNNLDEAVKNVKKANVDFEVLGDHVSHKNGIKRKIIKHADGTSDMIDEYGRSCIAGKEGFFEIEGFTKKASMNTNGVKNATNDVDNVARNVKNKVDDVTQNTHKTKKASYTKDNIRRTKDFFTRQTAKASAAFSTGTNTFNAIKSKIKNVNSNLNNKVINAKYKFINMNSTIRFKTNNLKQSLNNNASTMKSKIKNIDTSRAKQSIKDKISNSNGVKKVTDSLSTVKTKFEYANLYIKLNKTIKKTGFDLDYYRKARRSSSQYAKLIELANDVIELRAIEKNLGMDYSYFKNLDASDAAKKVHLTDMDSDALTARYRELTDKLDNYNGRNMSKEAIGNAEAIRKIDDAFAKLDILERKLGYGNGFYVSDKDIMVVNNEKGLATIQNEQGLSTIKNSELSSVKNTSIGYFNPVTDVVDDSVVRDFSKLKLLLKKAAAGTTLTVIFGGLIGDEEKDNNDILNNVGNTVVQDIPKPEVSNPEVSNPEISNSEISNSEITDEQEKNIYNNIKIGNEIDSYNVEYGHDSAYEAVNDENKEKLIKSYVNEKSLFKRFAVVNEDGTIGNISDAKNTTLEEFCRENNVTPNEVAVDIGNKQGASLAWVSVSELTDIAAD